MQKFDAPFGHIEVLEGTEKVGLSILVIYPGKEIKSHFHKNTKEVEIILEEELETNKKRLKEGSIFIWKLNEIHGYKNNTNANVKVLCITMPPYNETDVFEIGGKNDERRKP